MRALPKGGGLPHPAEEPMANTSKRRQPGRRHDPHGDRTSRAYKPWLRDESELRGVDCLWRER
jgi:hypothetical protein